MHPFLKGKYSKKLVHKRGNTETEKKNTVNLLHILNALIPIPYNQSQLQTGKSKRERKRTGNIRNILMKLLTMTIMALNCL